MIYTVPENMVYVIERKGAFHTIAMPGRLTLVPLVDKIVNKIIMTDQIMEIPEQSIISWDNQTSQVEAHVAYKVVDAPLYTYGVQNAEQAFQSLVVDTMINIFGDVRRPEMTTKHTELQKKIYSVVKETSRAWGIDVAEVDYRIIEN
jgi:regulator of protease activity HflC (stomatin/prohibitin superfamily)